MRVKDYILALLAGVVSWQAFNFYVVFWNSEECPTEEELIKGSGFELEVHKIQTSDGYILSLHRILNPRIKDPRKDVPPLLMMHGLFSYSAAFVSRGREHSLALILADHGYDVWLGNIRGNRNSREHVSYNTSDPRFWDFTLDEVANVDLAAHIDYVLNATQRNKINYLGFSLGYSLFTILLSNNPEYCSKINFVVTLAPVIFLNDLQDTGLRFIFEKYTPFMRGWFGEGETTLIPEKIIVKMCDERLVTHYLCRKIYSQGGPTDEYDTEKLKYFLEHAVSSTGLKLLEHSRQVLHLDSPASFADPDKNKTSERYALTNVQVPSVIMYSESDTVATVRNIMKIMELHPDFILYKVPKFEFNHLDFLFGNNAKELVYEEILRQLKGAREMSKPKLEENISGGK